MSTHQISFITLFLYWTRLCSEKILSLLPGSTLEFYKDATNFHTRLISNDFILERSLRKLSLFQSILPSHPQLVFEQGTGWHGIDLVILSLLGHSTITRDTRRLLRRKIIVRTISLLIANQDLIDQSLHPRLQYLSSLTSLPFKQFLAAMDVTYIVSTSMSLPNNAPIDLVYSDSVLQRFTIKDLTTFVSTSAKCRPSIRHWHRIDCCDFHSIDKKTIVPEFYYLTIPNFLWNTLTSKYINYQNRLRAADFLSIFNTYGISCHSVDEVFTQESRRWLLLNISSIRQPFRHLSIESLSISNFTLVSLT